MSEFAELLSDAKNAQKRISKAKYIEAQKELSEETYPLLLAVVEALMSLEDRVTSHDEEFDEIAEGTGNVIQPDMASNLLSCFAFARELCNLVKATPQTPEITTLITNLEFTLASCEAEVLENALPPEGMDEEEDGEETDEDTQASPPPVTAKPEPEAVQ